MFSRVRRTLAVTCLLCGAFASAPAAASAAPHRSAATPRSNVERKPVARGLAARSRRAEARRPPSPDFWNPLKRKRMAMPALPAAGADYAF